MVRPVGPLRVNNGDAMLPALMAGLGLGVLPEFLIHEAIADGRLEIVTPEWALRGGSVQLACALQRAPAQTFGGPQRFFHHKLSPRILQSKRVRDEDGGLWPKSPAVRHIVT